MKNIKNYLIIIIPFIFLIILLSVTKFTLYGESEMYVPIDSYYIDPGYYASTLFGKDITGNIEVDGMVNTNIIGTYEITYRLKYLWINRVRTRKVIVVENDINDMEIILNGSDKVFHLLGDKYYDEGAYVLNNKYSQRVENILITENNINENKIGEYEIKYSVNYGSDKKEKTRKVIVYQVVSNLSNSDNKTINMEVLGINNFAYIELPNGEITRDKMFSYAVGKDKYKFKIYTKDNDVIEYELNLENVNLDYVCNGVINRYGTTLEVKSSNLNDVIKYEWLINGASIDGKNTYNNAKSISNGRVRLSFQSGQSFEINCDIKDNLVYHFKYDINSFKPLIKCNTYSYQDKINMEAKLKQVIQDAGYGTRAGVVEAARFLVGALDYRIPYMGTKKENSAIGRYKKVGLNIGTSSSWGCNIDGYRQGIDCTNFIMWAFYQNGIDKHPYSHERSDTNSVLNQLRVGDLLYSPCNNCDTTKYVYGLTHVGIIIGIDDNYFYIAEANPAGPIMTRYEKNNMPTTGQFSLAKIFNYPADGNITNMWVE